MTNLQMLLTLMNVRKKTEFFYFYLIFGFFLIKDKIVYKVIWIPITCSNFQLFKLLAFFFQRFICSYMLILKGFPGIRSMRIRFFSTIFFVNFENFSSIDIWVFSIVSFKVLGILFSKIQKMDFFSSRFFQSTSTYIFVKACTHEEK